MTNPKIPPTFVRFLAREEAGSKTIKRIFMAYSQPQEAVLMLEDGTVFKGKSIGRVGTAAGEICFNTGMTGYQEIYTDPSYYAQIVVNTTSHIGNYGISHEEVESGDIKIRGLVVKAFSNLYSRNRADDSLQKYLDRAGIIGISDIDTRHLVRHIRHQGAMNAIISTEFSEEELTEKLRQVPSMKGLELASFVTTAQPYFEGNADAPYKVAVLDVGIKSSILKNLANRGCYCKVFPADTSFEDLQKWQPDGYFISNGPGDPEALDYAVKNVQKIIEKDLPIFGICLGHQIMCLAAGVSTYKMHNGHRGLNHPVKNLITGRCEITSQNHGFAVNREDVEQNENIILTHINLNDGTVEGIRLRGKNAFSVQYHPESSPGPHDSHYLFDEFIEMMEASRHQ